MQFISYAISLTGKGFVETEAVLIIEILSFGVLEVAFGGEEEVADLIVQEAVLLGLALQEGDRPEDHQNGEGAHVGQLVLPLRQLHFSGVHIEGGESHLELPVLDQAHHPLLLIVLCFIHR